MPLPSPQLEAYKLSYPHRQAIDIRVGEAKFDHNLEAWRAPLFAQPGLERFDQI